MSLRSQIVAFFLLVVLGAFAAVSYVIFSEIRPRYLEAMEESAVDTATLLAAMLAQEAEYGTINTGTIAKAMQQVKEAELHAKIFGVTKNKVDLSVYVTDASGILLYDSSGLHAQGEDFSNWRDVALTLRGEYGARSTKIDHALLQGSSAPIPATQISTLPSSAHTPPTQAPAGSSFDELAAEVSTYAASGSTSVQADLSPTGKAGADAPAQAHPQPAPPKTSGLFFQAEENALASVIYIAAPIERNGVLLGVVSVGKPKENAIHFIKLAQKKIILSVAIIGAAATLLGIGLSVWATEPLRQLTAQVKERVTSTSLTDATFNGAKNTENTGRRNDSGETGGRNGAAPSNTFKRGTAGIAEAAKPFTVPASGPPELKQLAQALVELQAKLEGKNYIEDYIRSLTHELKSPLTGIKGATEILRDSAEELQAEHPEHAAEAIKFLQNIEIDVNRMQTLVQRMLQLSRLENAKAIKQEPINCRALLHDLAQSYSTTLQSKTVSLHITCPEQMNIVGDGLLIRQALSNLLDNAISFTPAGSTVTITAAGISLAQVPPAGGLAEKTNTYTHATQQAELARQTERAATYSVFTVCDEGAGVPEFALARIFEKFFSLERPEGGNKSSGLGLPFVQQVSELHGGHIEAYNTEKGFKVSLLLPHLLP